MTILGFLLLFLGIALVCDGALSRGLLLTTLPDTGEAGGAAIRLGEVAVGGLIFTMVGFVFSTC